MPHQEEKTQWDGSNSQHRRRRDTIERLSRCMHNTSKITEGNLVRCGKCGKVVSLVRMPKP